MIVNMFDDCVFFAVKMLYDQKNTAVTPTSTGVTAVLHWLQMRQFFHNPLSRHPQLFIVVLQVLYIRGVDAPCFVRTFRHLV